MTTGAADPTSIAPAPAATAPDGSRISGLTSADAAAILARDGPNTIGGSGRRTLLAILVAQVASPLVLILVAASLVSLVVGDDVTAGIILVIVGLRTALGFVQEARSETAVAALQTGWFIESLFTQVLVVLVIRTRLSPFWRSRPSRPLIGAILGALAAAVLIPLSPLGPVLGFATLPPVFWALLVVLVGAHFGLVELVKRRFEPKASSGPRPGGTATVPGRVAAV
jgi:magnesium-transporting ATPase (P-type)